jgi:hypothetical protein
MFNWLDTRLHSCITLPFILVPFISTVFKFRWRCFIDCIGYSEGYLFSKIFHTLIGLSLQILMYFYVLFPSFLCNRGTRWRSWLRHCATNRKVAGSIPYGVIWIFHWHNPSGRTMALGSTQPCDKGGRCVGLTNLSPSYADRLKIWEPQPPGTLRACPGL